MIPDSEVFENPLSTRPRRGLVEKIKRGVGARAAVSRAAPPPPRRWGRTSDKCEQLRGGGDPARRSACEPNGDAGSGGGGEAPAWLSRASLLAQTAEPAKRPWSFSGRTCLLQQFRTDLPKQRGQSQRTWKSRSQGLPCLPHWTCLLQRSRHLKTALTAIV